MNWRRGRRDTWGWMGKEGRRRLKTLPSVSSELWSLTWKLPPPAESKYFLCARWMGGCMCVWQVSISPRDVSKPYIFTGSSSFVISLQTVWRSSIILFNLLYLKRPCVCALVCWASMRTYVYQKYRLACIRWAYYAVWVSQYGQLGCQTCSVHLNPDQLIARMFPFFCHHWPQMRRPQWGQLETSWRHTSQHQRSNINMEAGHQSK